MTASKNQNCKYKIFDNGLQSNTMFPLYGLGFAPLWNSYRIDLLFPFKTNNSARFLYRIAFTTQRFWKWYKIYRIGFTAAWKHAEYNGNSLIDWFSLKCGSVHVKIGNISKTLNLIERLNKSSKCFEELYNFFITSDVEKRAVLVARNLFIFLCYASQQTFLNFSIMKKQQKRNKIICKIISSNI